jgi:tetratricopeptide (TPR) repeat protein
LYQSRPWLDAAKEDLDRAISIFEEVGDERKKSIAYRRRGDFAHSRGQVIAAIHDYQEAIEADSKSGDYGVEAPARQGLAEVYTDIGDSDGAIEQLTRVLELLPSNAIIGRVGTFIALSIAKRIRGNLDEALAHLMEARRILLQGKPDAQFEECQSKIAAHMAMVHLLAGRIDEARTNAEEAGQLATKGNTPFALQVSIAIKTLLENFKPKTAIRIMRALTSMGRWFRAVRFWHIRRRMKPNNRGRAP